MSEPIDYDDLIADGIEAGGHWKDYADAIATLREQVAATTRERDTVLSNAKFLLAETDRLEADNAALREQVAAKATAIVGLEYEKVCHENAAEGYRQFCLMRKRAEKAEADNAALRDERDELFKWNAQLRDLLSVVPRYLISLYERLHSCPLRDGTLRLRQQIETAMRGGKK